MVSLCLYDAQLVLVCPGSSSGSEPVQYSVVRDALFVSGTLAAERDTAPCYSRRMYCGVSNCPFVAVCVSLRCALNQAACQCNPAPLRDSVTVLKWAVLAAAKP